MLKPVAAIGLLAVMVAGCGRQAQVSSPTSTAAPAPAPRSVAVTDGESLIRAMHARYENRWYRTMTVIQQATLMLPSGSQSQQTWYKAMSLPGRLRIDYVNPDLGNGLLFRVDSSYQFSGGRLARATTGWNELLVLGFDVYTQPPEVTISILRSLGYQLSRMRSSSFDGRTAYVIGASSITDTTSKQFWVERDRLVLVRALEKRPDGRMSDIRLGDFVAAGNGWLAKQVYQLVDGQTRVHEQYSNIKPDAPLDPALFDPAQWSVVKHWSKP